MTFIMGSRRDLNLLHPRHLHDLLVNYRLDHLLDLLVDAQLRDLHLEDCQTGSDKRGSNKMPVNPS